ncbi:IclR family transcriptional regulator [Flavonifractor hominis]|uniref:IclR family transcriptional regulator n=1 Tax=Flavonifractor hominis TaxID=3133178 RepID=A0ABV1EMM5_9FIRM
MESGHPNAIEKAILILNQFASGPNTYTAKELAEQLDLSKPTVHRILNTLEQADYIQRMPDGTYGVGYKAYHLGMNYANSTDLFLEIRREIDHLARLTGEQVGYAVRKGKDVVSLYESQLQDSRIRYLTGAIYPVNSGCYGKTLMAYAAPPEELPALVRSLKLEPVSPGAILDPEQLLAEYQSIRAHGYAESENEFLDGTLGLGVPVFNPDRTIHGCIALGALKSQSFLAKKDACLQELKRGAWRLEQVLVCFSN